MEIENSEALWLENQICFPMYAASRMITKLYTPLLNELGITYPQYLVLLVLWKEDRKLVSELSEKLFLESNTLTPLLKRLETKGIVIRERQKTDERKVLIALTDSGRTLKEKAQCIPYKIIEQTQSKELGVEEVYAFKNTLEKMMDVLANQKVFES